MIRIDLPHAAPLELTHAVFDLNGTLAYDGRLDPGLAPALRTLASRLTCILVSADTHGTLDEIATQVGLSAFRVRSGGEKLEILTDLRRSVGGAAQVAAVGNGRNDVEMFRAADLAIVVCGPEGTAVAALQAADVIARSGAEAVDLLLHPARLVATLRA